ncbi:unnamed protein product [Urochloa decumbens]|uniref:TFIIS N-terminal domain-containing protein n=1 Tax=Urochloa decumbens TaxID=240449 RepID=A0ABC9EQT5_9POAL
MALRRWNKAFLGAFPLIDAAIEGADGLLSRDEFRSTRARIVELLCNSADDDDEKAEALCALLDEAMAGSLATLRTVPAEKIPLATGGLVGAVRALVTGHPSERVRGLAGDVMRGWSAGVEAELATATARAKALASSLSPPPKDADTAPAAGSDTKAKKIPPEQPRPRKIAVASSCRARTTESYGPLPKKRAPPTIVSNSTVKPPSANAGAPTLVVRAQPQPKKTPPVAVVSSAAEEKKKLEATKRKLHERYQEAEDAKRRRTIQVIKAPRPPPGQRQRNAGPASRAAERCLVKSRSLRV